MLNLLFAFLFFLIPSSLWSMDRQIDQEDIKPLFCPGTYRLSNNMPRGSSHYDVNYAGVLLCIEYDKDLKDKDDRYTVILGYDKANQYYIPQIGKNKNDLLTDALAVRQLKEQTAGLLNYTFDKITPLSYLYQNKKQLYFLVQKEASGGQNNSQAKLTYNSPVPSKPKSFKECREQRKNRVPISLPIISVKTINHQCQEAVEDPNLLDETYKRIDHVRAIPILEIMKIAQMLDKAEISKEGRTYKVKDREGKNVEVGADFIHMLGDGKDPTAYENAIKVVNHSFGAPLFEERKSKEVILEHHHIELSQEMMNKCLYSLKHPHNEKLLEILLKNHETSHSCKLNEEEKRKGEHIRKVLIEYLLDFAEKN